MQTGCSAYLAMTQPGPINRTVFEQGTSRRFVIDELGAPVVSEEKSDGLHETYHYEEGHNIGWRLLRSLFYTAGDVVTLCLAEIVFFPTEKLAFEENKMSAVVLYEDPNEWKVREASTLRR